MEAMLEATRVYGNLSQFKEMRDFIMQNKGNWTYTQHLDMEPSTPSLAGVAVLECNMTHDLLAT